MNGKWIYFVGSAAGAFTAILILRVISGEGGIILGWRNALLLLVLTAVIGWAVGRLLHRTIGK